jgi:hypothetical protein
VVTASQLQSITNENVVILEFIKKTDGKFRQMMCTTCLPLLQSQEGYLYLRYRKPKQNPPYNPLPDNVIVWDIDKKDYRQIPAPRVKIKQVIPWTTYMRSIRNTL